MRQHLDAARKETVSELQKKKAEKKLSKSCRRKTKKGVRVCLCV